VAGQDKVKIYRSASPSREGSVHAMPRRNARRPSSPGNTQERFPFTTAATTFSDTLRLIRPTADEVRWREIPWQTDIRERCRLAAVQERPIFLVVPRLARFHLRDFVRGEPFAWPREAIRAASTPPNDIRTSAQSGENPRESRVVVDLDGYIGGALGEDK